MTLKVLIAHNAYQQAGGEDVVVETEKNLLSENEVCVVLFEESNHAIRGVKRVVVALNTTYSQHARAKFKKLLLKVKPDLVHVHNFFPLLTPSIYDSCADVGIPVVQTLHNYRMICPGAILMRANRVCEKCVTGSSYNAVIHKCYRSSVIGSFFVARMVSYHRGKETWRKNVNRYIALTAFAKSKFIEAGFPEQKISVKSNFIADPVSNHEMFYRENKALFVGRISQEKGVDVMLSAWNRVKYPLVVAGDGPKLINLENDSKKSGNVCFLGNQSKEQIHKLMSTARFLIMPSIWYEGFPMVLVEAFAHGLPVICSRLGGMAEIVDDGVTGLHFEAGDADDLTKKVNWMMNHPEDCERMGKNARLEYKKKYTPEKNYEMLIDIYRQAIDSNKAVGCEP